MNDPVSCKNTGPAGSENDKAYSKRRKKVSLISLIILAAFFATVTILLWKPLTGTFAQPEKFRVWVNTQGVLGRFAFLGMMALQVVFAILPGEPLELGAGYAFGNIEGTLLCLGGAALGSAIVYLFTKRFGVKIVEAFISREKLSSLKFMRQSKNLNLITFIVFFIPGTPKDIITYFIGLTSMQLKTFLLISSIARIPSVVTSTITGNALGTQNYTVAVIVFVLTGVISLLGIFVYNKISKAKQENAEQIAEEPEEK